ncbi:thiol-disulfide isomerase/thioredoxin [Mucilaginibacter frigoritolerans]|uniref:Thiol-disulfide isomerase/thioredoxin n=1 Tax=Mucilaginibacter frigoritolerans TaxID=652788 RepID=A0A562U7X1_9SPHI|nr:TlpA disulfide reductase family protein [Mucilaginibacter frigoritolerans]TWJ01465.1 thiol-disulfide isomerase/thioredoxin [Mucilaginibacter frigoritolerans]
MKKTILILCLITLVGVATKAQSTSINSFIADDQGILINSIAPDIVLPGINGYDIDANKSNYKYLLVNFWASWDRASRKQNPYFIKALDKFQSQGFGIMSVSVDSNVDFWQQAIKEDGTSGFLHLIDRDGLKSVYLKEFKVDFIPANFLIDNTGKVIAKNLRKNELYKLLATLLPDH